MIIKLTFSEINEKDKIIIDYLDNKYNRTAYIKELLYEIATKGYSNSGMGYGINAIPMPITMNYKSEQPNEEVVEDDIEDEEFEEIQGIDDIDI